MHAFCVLLILSVAPGGHGPVLCSAQHDQTVAVRRVVIEVKSTTDSKQDAKDINIVTTTSPSSDTIASYRQYDDTFILKDIESISKVSKSPKEEVEEVKEPPTGAGATAETIKKQLYLAIEEQRRLRTSWIYLQTRW